MHERITKTKALQYVFNKHKEAIFVVSTGYLSRSVYELYPEEKNIFYMQGSMGLAPSIGLGMAVASLKEVVVISGDAAFLMHLGITHTIQEQQLNNLFFYVLDNGCHESVGGFKCTGLEEAYPSVTEIIKIHRSSKPKRVQLSWQDNCRFLKEGFKS